jgi:chromosome partitioning protein
VKTIAVCCPNGGVGKTTTALALASAFARHGDSTLLVDVDPQGHSTLGLGIELDDDAPTVREVFVDPPIPAVQAIVSTSVPGLSMLPATIRLERLTQWLYMRPRREAVLARALKPLRSLFTWVVIDSPPSLGSLTEAAVAAADLVIVPCRMEARAGDGLVDLLEVITLLRGEGFSSWRILLTQIDKRKSVSNAAAAAALDPWTASMLATTIPQSEPLNHAQIARVDVFQYDSRCSGALAYDALAGEIRGLRAFAQGRRKHMTLWDPKARYCACGCGRAFTPTRRWQIFRDAKCRYRAWDEANPRVRTLTKRKWGSAEVART